MDTELVQPPAPTTPQIAPEQCGCVPVPEEAPPPKDNTNFWVLVAGVAFVLFLMFG